MKEQTQRRKRGGLEIQPSGDCWIEQALWRKFIEATKELKGDVERRKDALVVSGGSLDTKGLEDDVQELFSFRRRRNGSGSQVNDRCEFLQCVSRACRQCAEMVS